MRLYLLPISTRRTLLYCQQFDLGQAQKQTWSGWVQSRAAKTWADWEQRERGWQRSVANYGNYALRRIPYEEWGLKSVPPLSERRRMEELKGAAGEVEVLYPESLIPGSKVSDILKRLATERESLHRRRLIWSFVGMPATLPIAVIPIVPNLPFFYLVYRAWSHWRALAGGKHIQFLIQNDLCVPKRSPIIDQVYAGQKYPLPSTLEPTTDPAAEVLHIPGKHASDAAHRGGEAMLLSQENGKKMTEALNLPQLQVELERAIWQVETAINKQNEEPGPRSSVGSQESKRDAGPRGGDEKAGR